MSAPLFDVYISPGQDSSPSGQMRLVAAIAARFRVSAPTVAEGLQAGRFLLARAVNEATAARLQQQLREMGARASVEPAHNAPCSPDAPPQPARPLNTAAARAGSSIGLSPLGVRGNTKAGASPFLNANSGVGPSPLSAKGISLAPLGRTSDDMIPIAPAANERDAGPGAANAADKLDLLGPLDELPLGVVGASGGSPSPKGGSTPGSPPPLSPLTGNAPAPASVALAPTLSPGTPPARTAPPRGGSGLTSSPGSPSAGSPTDRRIETVRRAQSQAAPPMRTVSVAGLAPVRGAPGSEGDGLSVDTDNVNIVKCVVHGLYYNKLQASGCVRCMEVGRRAKKVMEEAVASSHGLHFGSAARRAFFGLAVALMLGFIPAAYYAQRINEEDVNRLRSRQEELSKTVATEEVLKEFDSIDASVETVRSRGMKVTLGIWVLVAGVAGLGWYRITDNS